MAAINDVRMETRILLLKQILRFVIDPLELLELLLGGGTLRHFDDVETHGLGQRAALPNGHRVTYGDVTKAGRQMGGDVLVPLFESLVFSDEMKVVSPDDDGALHLQLLNDAVEDSAADLDESGEGALLVDVFALLSFDGGLEAQTNVLHITDLLGFWSGDKSGLVVHEDIFLLLESTFRLIRHLDGFLYLKLINFKQIETTQL